MMEDMILLAAKEGEENSYAQTNKERSGLIWRLSIMIVRVYVYPQNWSIYHVLPIGEEL
jgi:hypothetical protein